MRKLVWLRVTSQVIFLALFVYILWATTYPLHSVISSRVVFQFDPLLMGAVSLSARVVAAGAVWSLLMVVLTLVLGRFFCGWVCPMGTLIDWTGAVNRNKSMAADKSARRCKWVKFILLAVIAAGALAGVQLAWWLDPEMITARVVSMGLIPSATSFLDGVCQFLIQKLGLYGGFYDFYRVMKEGILGVNVHFFSSSLVTVFFFILILFISLLISRFWCRVLCPLGAFYAVNAARPLLRRQVSGCTHCGRCQKACPTGAIDQGGRYSSAECVLCMECVYACPHQSTAFQWPKQPMKQIGGSGRGVTRKEFLSMTAGAVMLCRSKTSLAASAGGRLGAKLIRPPGVASEDEFINACVRCGNCMKVCLTNGLQPSVLESGAAGIWTPHLVPEIGYCEYNCALCGEVCPTSAIPRLSLEDKQSKKMGVAKVDPSMCLAWTINKDCLVCEEHCPVADKAIKIRHDNVDGREIKRPVVDPERCIGCGICQNKCPARPLRGIRVTPDFS